MKHYFKGLNGRTATVTFKNGVAFISYPKQDLTYSVPENIFFKDLKKGYWKRVS